MNITFKFLLNTRRINKQEQYPIVLRVYKGTFYNEHSLKIKIHKDYWDIVNQMVSPECADYEMYNTKISSVRTKVQRQILFGELSEINDALPQDIIKAISNTGKPTAVIEKPCIIKYGQGLIKTLSDSGKVGNAFVYSCAINKLKSFVKTENFPFEALTYKKLNEFQDSM